jgi:multiple sugar transport system permease protein
MKFDLRKMLNLKSSSERADARRERPQYKSIDTKSMTLVLKEGGLTAVQMETLQKIMKVISMVLIYAFLAVMAVIILLPFYWMIITSLKTNTEIRASQQTFWPEVVMWSNYVDVFDRFDFATYLVNTLVVGILSTIGTLFTTIFAAFAFARLQFKGKNFLFTLLLATMMIPGEMMVITNYITVANFGWLKDQTGVFAAMIVPFWISVFYIYLLRQNFLQIPNELYLASKVDGKTDWNYLWRSWYPSACRRSSDLHLKIDGCLELLRLAELSGRQTGIPTDYQRSSFFFLDNGGEPEYALQMAATVLVTVPLLLLFIFFRKYIMKGVGRAGIKG